MRLISRRALCRRAPALFVVLVALWLAAPTAHAHTGLVSSTPADGAVVEGPLRRIVLEFSGTPTALDDTLAVADADGNVFRPDSVEQDGLRIVARFVPPLPAATYAASWQVRSDDTHIVSGEFTFAVSAPPPTTAAPTTVAPTTAAPATEAPVATSVAPETSTTAAPSTVPPSATTTAVTTTTSVVTAPLDPEPADMDVVAAPVLDDAGSGDQLARIGRIIAFPALLSAVGVFAFIRLTGVGADAAWLTKVVGWLAATAAVGAMIEVAGVADSLGGVGELSSEGAGQAGLLRLVGALVASVALLASRRTVTSAGVLIGFGLALVSFGLDGHTVTEGPRAVHLVATVVHVAAAGVWVGGVVALGLVLLRRRRRSEPSGAGPMVVSFALVATIALVVVVLAGGVMTAMIEPDVVGAGTDWARTWWTKVVLVAIAAALGAYHHLRVRPRLAAGGDTEVTEQHLRRSIVVESVLLIAAAVASAVLVTASLV